MDGVADAINMELKYEGTPRPRTAQANKEERANEENGVLNPHLPVGCEQARNEMGYSPFGKTGDYRRTPFFWSRARPVDMRPYWNRALSTAGPEPGHGS